MREYIVLERQELAVSFRSGSEGLLCAFQTMKLYGRAKPSVLDFGRTFSGSKLLVGIMSSAVLSVLGGFWVSLESSDEEMTRVD